MLLKHRSALLLRNNSFIKFHNAQIFSFSKDSKNNYISSDSSSFKKYYEKYFGLPTNFASPTFKSRWLMVIPAFFTHLCIGSPWAWSVVAGSLVNLIHLKYIHI